jgi:FlaA1/EpsC-like NDP-sugar epimerase
MNKTLKTTLLIILDVVFVLLSYVLPLFREDILYCFANNYYFFLGGIALTVLLNFSFKLYSGLLNYVGVIDAIKIAVSALVALFYNLVVAVVSKELTVEWAMISTMVAYVCVFITRFYPRAVGYMKAYGKRREEIDSRTRLMIIGAGSAGSILIREMKNSVKSTMLPVCVLDDDPNKIGKYINGVKVVGRSGEVEYYAKKYGVQEIIIAMPSASKKVVSRLISVCQRTQCKIKTVPGIFQLASGQVSVSDIKNVSIDDLLGREQVEVNLNEIMGYIEGKTVLVTGGGGSIGSELCRQIARHNPEQLIVVDIYENNAYDIQQELLRHIPNLNLKVLIASVRDETKINSLFDKYRPHIVFHAAAHKHVPLMEDSPNEAVKNNVGGTFNVADAAGRYNAEKFILISTDKAVNPTNIMGATKRICEMIIQTMDKKYDTEYVAVRFGNVLGSNGSVIPLFKRQIREGGPVTVTHKDIVRYFMTIPEAVSLVLQAGAYAKGGEIFVLDMGEPVRIYDLAVNMIKLSGFEPHTDIEIKITGLRPGEKLYEERLMAEEGLERTENKMISIGKPLEIDEKHLFGKIKRLEMEAIEETDKMKELVHELVPSYKIDVRS